MNSIEFGTCSICVIMNWKVSSAPACEVQSVQYFTIENNSGAEIHWDLCAEYGEDNVMNLANIQ